MPESVLLTEEDRALLIKASYLLKDMAERKIKTYERKIRRYNQVRQLWEVHTKNKRYCIPEAGRRVDGVGGSNEYDESMKTNNLRARFKCSTVFYHALKKTTMGWNFIKSSIEGRAMAMLQILTLGVQKRNTWRDIMCTVAICQVLPKSMSSM